MADTMEEDPSSGLQSSDEEMVEDTDEAVVESLVSGRAKRSTAGRHMSALIDAAADDDLTLLFEEVEDDNEFDVDVEAAEEEDMGLDSSDDDDDDQGPNAQNDYEGEKQLQKEERKKRRAQNDLRFQTLRKRVKIDPTAVSTPSAIPPPRPKKKSERISWLPTVEDGPVRSSSRRQTMVNKEMTHARLKDSQEKRIRIIATMKEAERRKAHLKPKQMSQEEHLAEAERIERLNSKSLNRWEKTERRKAEERRARIEALQNRRLEGPVISYWSGLATREEEKKESDEKAAVDAQGTQGATTKPGETITQPEGAPPATAVPSVQAADSVQPTQPAQPAPDAPTQNENPSIPAPGEDATTQSANTPSATTAAEPLSTSAKEPAHPNQGSEVNTDAEKKPDRLAAETSRKASSSTGEVVIPAQSSPSRESPMQPPTKPSPSDGTEAMHLDQFTAPSDALKVETPAQDPANVPSSGGDTQITQITSGETPQASTETKASEASSDHVPDTAPINAPLESKAPAESLADAAPLHTTPPAVPVTQGEPSLLQSQAESSNAIEGSLQPEAPPPLHKKYSIYFNAKKPPRLTKISSSLCVITSLPSRYRDPETSLPYANSYAYGQIRKMLSQGYIWSSMLGCFVGSAETAARGVPERFVGKAINGVTVKQEEPKEQESQSKEPVKPNSETTAGQGNSAAEPMAVDG
ncbi:YL1 nuclear C-terminal [Penicillium hetheringtonii]|uniref:YL1 nuclear C-terminal n=1 Tax=Penicillium hetheringtonii TaxID=911720 RepID=A0AAD6DNZ9_9EURO|nr:YL1 nuclear C-terminal [Penicillium hetheringtonii]